MTEADVYRIDAPPGNDSPNREIDRAIKKLMKKVDSEPTEIAVKIIAQAVQWEKVKFGMKDDDDAFDPNDL